MPTFETSECYATTPARAFALFRRPAERVRLAPPELHLHLEEGPDELQWGSRLTVRGRRWGVTQRMAERDHGVRGGSADRGGAAAGSVPVWRHVQRFAPSPDGGVRITDAIEYEPPGGVLGRLATAEAIRRELEGRSRIGGSG